MTKQLPNGFELKHIECVGSSPVNAFLADEIYKLRQKGLANDGSQVNWDTQAFYIFNPFEHVYNGVVAALCFNKQAWDSAVSVGWGAVMEGYRRRGFSTILIERVEQWALENNLLYIKRSTSPENAAMQKAMTKQGYAVDAICYRKFLTGTPFLGTSS